MGKHKERLFMEKVTNKTQQIEAKLLIYYVCVEFVWALVVSIGYFFIHMPIQSVIAYAALALGLSTFIIGGKIVEKEAFFSKMYFPLVLLTIPVLWYFSGGVKSSANILFVCEIVIFILCLRGVKQKVYVALGLVSTAVLQALAPRLGLEGVALEPMQIQVGGAIFGLSTTILIGLILMKQKREYDKEKEALLASERELEKSNSMQKNFLANMSHEIRSPLGIVMGFNNLISDSDDIDVIHEYSKDITQAGTTLLTVINDILDYSKIESGKLDIIEADYSFLGLMDEIRKDIGLKCSEKGLEFEEIIDRKIPESLYGDNIRVKQCLLNVLSNAVKYTPKGKVSFEVEDITEQSRENGDALQPDATKTSDERLHVLRFTVRDTGKGISKEAIPNLYSAFKRLDEGTNRGIEGTGLGLAITKNLLDEMHGSIAVESELGKGTVFTITITQREGKEKKLEVKGKTSLRLESFRILIVDDTKLNLTLIRRMLEKTGADITTAESGAACLEDAAVHLYDLILLDHMMPGMDGVEVFKKLRGTEGINQNTPVIMLTANAMAGAAQEYQELGFDGYLSKPIVPEKLMETLGYWANRKADRTAT